jgi:DNA-binding transcriptional ArsR family regulator
MKADAAVVLLSALAQQSRLAIFRLLVEKGPEGLPAGQIAARLKLSPATLSFHLKELSHAGLTESSQDGRFVIYSANFVAMNKLIAFLTRNCCAGSACAPDGSVCLPTTTVARSRR